MKYKGTKIADTGVDPHGAFAEFMKKDVFEKINVNRQSAPHLLQIEARQTDFENNKTKWAVGTTKFTKKFVDEEGFLPPAEPAPIPEPKTVTFTAARNIRRPDSEVVGLTLPKGNAN